MKRKTEHRWVVGTEPYHAEASLVSEGTSWYELTDVWCHPTQRRQGWATEAIKAALAFADKQGRQVVLRLYAHDGDRGPDNEQLRLLYEKFGFSDFPRPLSPYDMLRPIQAETTDEAATAPARAL